MSVVSKDPLQKKIYGNWKVVNQTTNIEYLHGQDSMQSYHYTSFYENSINTETYTSLDSTGQIIDTIPLIQYHFKRNGKVNFETQWISNNILESEITEGVWEIKNEFLIISYDQTLDPHFTIRKLNDSQLELYYERNIVYGQDTYKNQWILIVFEKH